MIERKAVAVSRLKDNPFDELQQRRNRVFDKRMTEVRRMREELRQLGEQIERTEQEARKHGLIR